MSAPSQKGSRVSFGDAPPSVRLPEKPPVDEEEQAALRLEAGCALLALARTRSLSVTSVMGPERWHRLGDCMQDEDPDVRAKYGDFVRNVVAARRGGATLKELRLDAL